VNELPNCSVWAHSPPHEEGNAPTSACHQFIHTFADRRHSDLKDQFKRKLNLAHRACQRGDPAGNGIDGSAAVRSLNEHSGSG